MTALCSGKICTIFPEKGALNFWKACTIALEYSISTSYVKKKHVSLFHIDYIVVKYVILFWYLAKEEWYKKEHMRIY